MKRLILNADNRSPDEEGYWKYMIDLTKEYAKKWDFEFKFYTYGDSMERHPSWERINVLKSLIAEYDEILWLDTDASIINHSINVFEYLKTAPESPTWTRITGTVPVIYAVSDKPYTKFGCAGIFLLDCTNKTNAMNVLNSWWNDIPDPSFAQTHPWEQTVWNRIWSNDDVKRSWIRVADIWTTRLEEKDQVFIHLIHSNKNKRYNEARRFHKHTLCPHTCKRKIGIFIDKFADNYKSIYLRILLEAQGHRVEFLAENLPLKDCVIMDNCPYFIYNTNEIEVSDYCQFICTSLIPSNIFFDKNKSKHFSLFFNHIIPKQVSLFNEIWHDTTISNTILLELKRFNVTLIKIPLLYDPCLNTIQNKITEANLEIAILCSSLTNDTNALEIACRSSATKIHVFDTPKNSGFRELSFVKEKNVTLYSKIPIYDILSHFKSKNVIFISYHEELTHDIIEIVKSGFRLINNVTELRSIYGVETKDVLQSSDISKLHFKNDTKIFFENMDLYYKIIHKSCNGPLVLTYDNKPTDASHVFFNSLKTNGWDFRLVGEGDDWRGFVTRMTGYLNFLKTLHHEQLVILSDARDVICVRPPKAFSKGFAFFKKPIVVSMELFCEGHLIPPDDHLLKMWQCLPLNKYWAYHNIKNPKRKYVNAGLIAGKVNALIEMYEWILKNKFKDDQLGLGHFMVTFPEKVAADYDALLLHTTTSVVYAGLNDIHIQASDSPTFAELLGRSAFFLHFPGTHNNGQAMLYNTIKELVKSGLNCSKLTGPYGWDEPDWVDPESPSPYLKNTVVTTTSRLTIHEVSECPSNKTTGT